LFKINYTQKSSGIRMRQVLTLLNSSANKILDEKNRVRRNLNSETIAALRLRLQLLSLA
jgi:hypothetical protein